MARLVPYMVHTSDDATAEDHRCSILRSLDLKPSELDLWDSFYVDEWEQVIQARGVVSEQEYRHVSRVGRDSQ